MPKQPTLHALLIGINDYNPPVPALEGCVPDAKRLEAYLNKQQKDFDLQLHCLHDEKATKKNIIRIIRNELTRAKEGDSVLITYSGHGMQEFADQDLWPQERDGMLECLVCYNPEGDTDFLLADKELRYLIHEIQAPFLNSTDPPHVVLLMDCCHSGDNTRSIPQGLPGQRTTLQTAKQRSKENFFFWDENRSADFDRLPFMQQESRHLQMAACQDRQIAKEDFLLGAEKSGVFTTSLLELLERQNGNLTYYDLKRQLGALTKYRYDQVPQLYTAGQQDDQFLGFLKRKVDQSQSLTAEAHFNPRKTWVLDRGSLHGINNRMNGITILDEQGEPLTIAQVKAVETDHTLLSIKPADSTRLDRKKPYRCRIPTQFALPFGLFLNNIELSKERFTSLQQELKEQSGLFNVLEKEKGADFTLHLEEETYTLTRAYDPYRPVAEAINASKNRRERGNDIKELKAYLAQMSQFRYLQQLQSEPRERAVFGSRLPISIECAFNGEQGNWTTVKQEKEFFHIPMQRVMHAKYDWRQDVRLVFHNKLSRPVWLGLIFLDVNFSANARILNPPVQAIEPGGKPLELEFSPYLERYFEQYNWPGSQIQFKLIISTLDNINLIPLVFNMEQGLPAPYYLGGDKGRGGLFGGDRNIHQEHGWMTQDLVLELQNPHFNKVCPDLLTLMLEDGRMRPYAEHHYLAQPYRPGQEPLLKEGIVFAEGSCFSAIRNEV